MIENPIPEIDLTKCSRGDHKVVTRDGRTGVYAGTRPPCQGRKAYTHRVRFKANWRCDRMTPCWPYTISYPANGRYTEKGSDTKLDIVKIIPAGGALTKPEPAANPPNTKEETPMYTQDTDYKRVIAEMAAERRRQTDEARRAKSAADAKELEALGATLAPLLAVLQSVKDDPDLSVTGASGPARGPFGVVWPSVKPRPDRVRRAQAGTVAISVECHSGPCVFIRLCGSPYDQSAVDRADSLIPVLLGLIADMKTVVPL